jgi:hypothetical protein
MRLYRFASAVSGFAFFDAMTCLVGPGEPKSSELALIIGSQLADLIKARGHRAQQAGYSVGEAAANRKPLRPAERDCSDGPVGGRAGLVLGGPHRDAAELRVDRDLVDDEAAIGRA